MASRGARLHESLNGCIHSFVSPLPKFGLDLQQYFVHFPLCRRTGELPDGRN